MDRSSLPPGKVPPELLRRHALGRGATRAEVLVGPAIGEDAAVVDLGGSLAVLSSDPITGASKRAGWLGVHVACNDIAAMGAAPLGVLVTLLLPPRDAVLHLETIMADVDRACADLGVAVLGGHSEVTAALSEPILTLTALGRAEAGRYVGSAGASPGDELIVTKAAAIEGTAILATDFADELTRELGAELVEEAQRFWSEISVVREGLAAAAAGATAMHDVTEGGVLGALHELADAGGTGLRVRIEQIPRRAATDAICGYFSVDPLALVSSGSLLIAAPKERRVAERLRAEGIEATSIGEVAPGERRLLLRGKNMPLFAPPRDELWRLLEERAR
ncbi:MAG TPA: AIR synthase family protein [Chloroflexota bacterium]|jgi:hydrogenase maturation factor